MGQYGNCLFHFCYFSVLCVLFVCCHGRKCIVVLKFCFGFDVFLFFPIHCWWHKSLIYIQKEFDPLNIVSSFSFTFSFREFTKLVPPSILGMRTQNPKFVCWFRGLSLRKMLVVAAQYANFVRQYNMYSSRVLFLLIEYVVQMWCWPYGAIKFEVMDHPLDHILINGILFVAMYMREIEAAPFLFLFLVVVGLDQH